MKGSTQESEEKVKEILSDMDKKEKKKYNDTLLIVKCLNELEKFLEKKKDLYSPLILTEKDIFNSFNLVKIQVDYYWQNVKKGNKINHYKEIYLETFELLFLGEKDFNYDRLSEKIAFFDLFQQAYPTDGEKKYIDKISEKKKEWAKIINLLFISFHRFGLLFCGWLDFSVEKTRLFQFLVNYSRIYYKINVDLNIQEINKVEDRKIAEFFNDLISNDCDDYIKIVINENNLEIKLQDPDELMTSFQKEYEEEEEDPDLSGKNAVKRIITDVKQKIKTKKSKARKKRKNEKDKIGAKNNDKKKEEIKEEEKKQENEINSNSNNPIPNESYIQPPDKNEIKTISTDEEKKKAIQEEMVIENIKSLEERIRKLEERNKEMEKRNTEMEKRNKEMEKRNIEMEKRNTEMEHAIFFMANKNKNLKNRHNTLKKKVKETEIKLSRVEDTVNLIQARDAIKAFIDFFYFGLKFTELISYEERVNKILVRLKSKQNIKKIDPTLLSEINFLLASCSRKLKLGNDYAHKFDRTKDVFAKLFSEIDPNKNCNNIRNKLEKGNTDKIIFKLLDVRDNFHSNKAKLYEEEKALYDAMPQSLDSALFIKNDN